MHPCLADQVVDEGHLVHHVPKRSDNVAEMLAAAAVTFEIEG